MLTVYSAHGSPGASTTAMYLAAQWASTGTEVLLIEADPGGGSLSHHLGIQFTPGSASFVASGLPVRGGNLIDHSQDVLFNNLHVMPATSSPTGAREIVRWWDKRAGELREIAETEMAVIIDGGRITADSAAADLTVHATGVVVVARGDSSPTGLEHIGALLSAEACGPDVERCVVTVGDSPLSAEEWAEKCDVTFAGAVRESAEVTGDLSAFLNRNRRKSRKWRVSLEEVAGELLRYAKPPTSGPVRSRRSAVAEAEPAARDGSAPPPPAGDGEPAPGARSAAHEHDVAHEVRDEAPVAGSYGEPAPQPGPYHGAAAADYGQAPPPAEHPHYQAASPYAAPPPPPPEYAHYPPEGQMAYYEPPPAPPEPLSYDAPLPVYEPPPAAHEPPHPQQPGYGVPPEVPAVHRHQDVAPPWAPAPTEPPPHPQHAHQPRPEPAPHDTDPAYRQQPAHEPPPAVGPAYPPQPSYGDSPEPAPGSQPPSYQQPEPHQPVRQPPPPPADLAPSGSFRDWANRLHAQAPPGTPTTGHGGAS